METQTTRTVEEIEAELAAARAVLKAQEDALKAESAAAAAAEHKEARAVAQQVLIDKMRPHMVKIQEELAALGVVTEIVEGRVSDEYYDILPKLSLSSYSYSPKFTERRTGGSSWRIGTLVGYNITIGDYGEKKTFPPKKDGTYSYGKIAEEIANRIENSKRATERESELRASVASAEEIAKALGGDVCSSGYDGRGRWSQKTPTIVLSLLEARTLRDLLAKLPKTE